MQPPSAFLVPRVVAFTGHVTDAPDRAAPRFPERRVPEVRAAIRAFLDGGGPVIGFASAARGADLLFLQELLERGGLARVYLPFPAAAFRATSVGAGWVERFDHVLAALKPEDTLTVLSAAVPPASGQPAAYEACNQRFLAAAAAAAVALGGTPVLLAVWDGAPSEAPGGAASAIAAWQSRGLPVEIIGV